MHSFERRVGERLAAVSDSRDTVMTEPLGTIGFYSGRQMADYPGLASPAVSRAIRELGKPVGTRPDNPTIMRFVLDRVKPTVLVLRDEEYHSLKRAGVLANYRVVDEIDRDSKSFPIGGVETMLILREIQ